ncbi:hypothetical protein R20233_02029 [Ralstonia sp. LMG 32965]|nr:hypothetical protein R20233_02029 [Ralstonia sp. LMG 32965]
MCNKQVSGAPLLEEARQLGSTVNVSHRCFDARRPCRRLHIYRGAFSAAQMASRTAN